MWVDKHSGARVKKTAAINLPDGPVSVEEVLDAQPIEGVVIVQAEHGRPFAMLESLFNEHYRAM